MMSRAEMTATWTALPLVVSSADGTSSDDGGTKLLVPEAARAYLQSLHAPSIHIVGVMGPPHTGKRLLLKTILHADAAAFGSTPTDSHERVLLWLWRPPFDSDDRARLVISAGAQTTDEHSERRISTALLLLLSSVLLYNDDGEIDEQALERLAWLRDVSSSLRIKPNQDDDGVASDFHHHAPLFVWVQHNSKIKWLTDSATGDKMTPTQYLEKCLSEESGFSDAVAERNAQRMYLQSLFKRRECVALSRAVEAGASGENSELLPREKLRTQFVDAVEKQVAGAFLFGTRHQLPAKTLLGRELRADQLLHVVDAYVASVNANALPAMQVAANALLQKAVEDALVAARGEYEESMKSTRTEDEDALVVGAREVHVAHWRGLQRALISLQSLQSVLSDQTKKTLLNDALVTLRSECSKQVEQLLVTNSSVSKELCEQLLTQVLPANLDQIAVALASTPRESFSDGLVAQLTQYKSDLRDAVGQYTTQGAGPALYSALAEALQVAVFESIKTYGASVLRQYQEHMRTFQEQRVEMEHELEIAKTQDTNAAFSTDDHKRLYEDQLEQSTQQLTELRRVLLGELNGKKSELDRLVSDMSTMDAKHDVRVRNMESDLAYVRSRTAELEKEALVERQRLEEDVTGATEEILVKERSFHQEERSLLAQQKDLLSRVVELERELVQKKTKHVQHTFAIESELAKRMDELRQEQAEFARQLKSQGKTDTGVLKLAYQKKKAAVQSEIDRVARDLQEYEAKLKTLEMARSPLHARTTNASGSASATASSPGATTTATTSPGATTTNTTTPALSAAVVAALRTSSREFLFKSPDVLSPKANGSAAASSVDGTTTATTATRLKRSDTEMCKTQ